MLELGVGSTVHRGTGYAAFVRVTPGRLRLAARVMFVPSNHAAPPYGPQDIQRLSAPFDRLGLNPAVLDGVGSSIKRQQKATVNRTPFDAMGIPSLEVSLTALWVDPIPLRCERPRVLLSINPVASAVGTGQFFRISDDSIISLRRLSGILPVMHPGYCPQCGERVTPYAAGCALCGADLDPRRWQRPVPLRHRWSSRLPGRWRAALPARHVHTRTPNAR